MAVFSSKLVNPESISIESRKRKRSRIQNRTTAAGARRWNSEVEQQLYTSKFVKALRDQKNRNSPDVVREASYRTLAISARGTTRWSRAILKADPTMPRMKKNIRIVGVNVNQFRQRVSFLGRLVPGCRRQGLPVILEEARDYISALEMQVRAMAALANLLSC